MQNNEYIYGFYIGNVKQVFGCNYFLNWFVWYEVTVNKNNGYLFSTSYTYIYFIPQVQIKDKA